MKTSPLFFVNLQSKNSNVFSCLVVVNSAKFFEPHLATNPTLIITEVYAS